MPKVTPEEIDALLPQTQCGLCGYKGCLPYAKALAESDAAINLCPPGGVNTLLSLSELLQIDASPFLSEMEEKEKPLLKAVIREDECIGCAKCITACPVDAILGSAKQMHTVLSAECTGCELCISPCPVDCIDMIVISKPSTTLTKKSKADLARQRFYAKEERQKQEPVNNDSLAPIDTLQEKRNYIKEAIARARMKKV